MFSFQFLPPTKQRLQPLDHFPVWRLMFLSFEYLGIHTTRVFFDPKRILRYPPSVKSKLILCKNSIHDFIFEKYWPSETKKCYIMVGSIWKNACTVITDCTQSNHREKSFLNQNPTTTIYNIYFLFRFSYIQGHYTLQMRVMSPKKT